jgi:prepilin-type N-terminal cleavage/methylation domain-containing protein
MLNRKQQRPSRPNSQSGFTIMESLLAIIVVAILLTAVAPLIVFSVGTRVQARRVDQATQAARAYIDGVKAGTIVPPNYVVTLNEVATDTTTGTTSFQSQRATFATTPAPASDSLTCTTPIKGYCNDPDAAPNSTTPSLYCVDLDQGGCSSSSNRDLIVQGFRSVYEATPGDPSTLVTSPNSGYLLGVRVYRADAFTSGRTLIKSEQEGTFTGGTGLKPSQAPLVEVTTEVVGKGTTYQDFCTRFGGCQG